jgi:hypothetical protein
MANKTWLGGTGVWDLDTNWSPTGIPAAADTCFIVSGDVDITGATVASGSVTRIVVGANYTGSIGTSALQLGVDCADLDYGGRGDEAHFLGTYTTITVQETGSGSSALNIYGNGTDDRLTTLRIVGGRGGINIDGTCIFNTGGVIDQIGSNGVTTTMGSAITFDGTCQATIDSGVFVMDVAVPNITMFGGTLESTLASGTITLWEIYDGRAKFTPTASCTISQLTMYGGNFDTEDSTAPSFVITDCTLFDSSLLNEMSGLRNILFTFPVKMEGGEIRYDIGRTIAIS